VGRSRSRRETAQRDISWALLALNEVMRFLGYEKVREIDELSKAQRTSTANVLLAVGVSVVIIRARPRSLGAETIRHWRE
jgi:hypothetical protein